jgi:hypothetical protein
MIYLTASHLHQPPAGLCSAERFAPATCEATVENSPYLVIFNGMWWDMTKNRMDISTIMVQNCVEWLEFLYTPHPIMDSNILVKYTMFKWVRWYRFFCQVPMMFKKWFWKSSKIVCTWHSTRIKTMRKPEISRKASWPAFVFELPQLLFFDLAEPRRHKAAVVNCSCSLQKPSKSAKKRAKKASSFLGSSPQHSTPHIRRIPGEHWPNFFGQGSSADTPWDASQSICLP